MSLNGLDAAEQLRREQERAAQLESYAADLSRTYAELRRHLHQVTVLHEVNTRIASALDPDEVVASMLDSLAELLTYRVATVYLLDLEMTADPDGPRSLVPAATPPRLRAGRTFEGQDHPARHFQGSVAAQDSIVVRAMRELKSITCPDPDGAVELVVPLYAGVRSLGALQLHLAEPLPEQQVKLLELLAAAAAVALHNAHLYQETQRLAITDPLTGLSNYRHFHDLLEMEVQRARRMGYPVGLLLMDLDHFKVVNDRHGHPIGDLALRQVAEQIRSRLRRTDVVGRLGGEEFGAILPSATRHEVGIVAEKLRRAVAELPPLRGGMTSTPTQMTLSVGGTSLGPEVVDRELLVSRADHALYEAKRNGRNQVCLWSE